MNGKKGAISLSVNIMVILIISIFILGLGISFLAKLMGTGETVKDQLDAETERQLEQLLVKQGDKVALPLNKITLHRGQDHIFGVGVLISSAILSIKLSL